MQVAANAAIDYVTNPWLWKTGWVGLEAAGGAAIIQSTVTNIISLTQTLLFPTR
jgi:hypothetical protein